MTYFEQEQPVVDEVLFEQGFNTAVVPRNEEEVASQVALAKDDPRPYEERLKEAQQLIRSAQLGESGLPQYQEEVNVQEKAEQLLALRQYADKAAAAMDAPTVEWSAKVMRQLHEVKPTAHDADKALASRSLERMAIDYAINRYKDNRQFAEKLDKESEKLSLRNVINRKQAQLEGETTFYDKASHFLTMFLPFYHDWQVNRTISKYTGTDRYLDTKGAVDDLRTLWVGLDPSERISLIKEMAKESIGLAGYNPAATEEMLRKLVDLNESDAALDAAFNTLGIADVAAIGKLLARTVARGAPIRTVNEIAGNKAAADMVATDLQNGTHVSGVNDANLAARSLAAGKNPFIHDPTALAGLAPDVQERLVKDWNKTIDELRNRLISSGASKEEIARGLEEIKKAYLDPTNKSIHSVIFGEGDELGQRMIVTWRNKDGKSFLTREAAEEHAREAGMIDFEVVPDLVELGDAQLTEAMANYRGKLPPGISPEDLATPPSSVRTLADLAGRDAADIEAWFKLEYDHVYAAVDSDHIQARLLDMWKKAALAGRKFLNARELVEAMAKVSKGEKHMTLLARHILAMADKNGIALNKIRVVMDETTVQVARAQAVYHAGEDAIAIGRRYLNSPESHLHEVMHAMTLQVMVAEGSPALAKHLTPLQIKAVKEIKNLGVQLGRWADERLTTNLEKYVTDHILAGASATDMMPHIQEFINRLKGAMQHPGEFITYGLTNKYVRDFLGRVPLSELPGTAIGERGSIFDRLWKAFKDLLGFGKDDTALKKLLFEYDNIIRTQTEEQRTVISRAFKKKQISVDDYVKFRDRWFLEDVEHAKATRGWVVRERRIDPLSYANKGKYSQQDIESMPWAAFDPKHAASERAVEERVIGVHAEAKVRKDLENFITPYFQKLNNASKKKVHDILVEGDAYSNGGAVGKEYTAAELLGRGFSDDEAAAYFATRSARMLSWHIRNGEMVRSLRAQGFREVELTSTGNKYAGKALSEIEALGAGAGKSVFDTTTGESVRVTGEMLAQAYKDGKKLVKFKEAVSHHGGYHTMMLVDDTTSKIRDMHVAVGYRPGEFSRIYTDQYFIRMFRNVNIDGAMARVPFTVRTALSHTEAAEFVKRHDEAIRLLRADKEAPIGNLNEKLEKLVGKWEEVEELRFRFDEGEFEGYDGMDWHFTRNKDEFLDSSMKEHSFNGRLFTDQRGQKLWSVDRARTNTLDVYESLARELTNISKVATISEWREDNVRRWMNTFGHLLPNRTGDDVADFFKAAGATFSRGDQESVFAQRTHRYIMRQLGMKSTEEQWYSNISRRLTEKFISGQGAEKLDHLGASVRQAGVLNFLRKINFDLTLGMFNPAQLIVQANGAATAVMLSPIHGAKAVYTYPLLRMALMSDNPEVWRKMATFEKFSKLGVSNKEEFIDLVKAVRKTGILDNLKSTSLWNMEEGAFDMFGTTGSKIKGSHTFFFNRGEEFSRLVSFDVARREWMAKNPGQAWNADSALKEIVVRMDDLTQNMTKANLARWQEGALSIPLQFAQYNIKLALNVMNAAIQGGSKGYRGFTRFEAANLVVGHLLFYGAAGNGMMGVLDEVLPEELKDSLPQGAKEAMVQGLVSTLLNTIIEGVSGEEQSHVAFGSRLGSFDFYPRLAKTLFSEDSSLYQAILGPTMGTGKRLGVIGDVVRLWHYDPEVTAQDVAEGILKIGTEQIATLRNATKAYLYYQNQGLVIGPQGSPLGKVNGAEIVAQALGFTPSATVDYYNQVQNMKDHKEVIKDLADIVYKAQKDMMTAYRAGDNKRAEEHRKTLSAIFAKMNAGDMFEVQRYVKDRLFPYDTKMQELMGEHLWKGSNYPKATTPSTPPTKE